MNTMKGHVFYNAIKNVHTFIIKYTFQLVNVLTHKDLQVHLSAHV